MKDLLTRQKALQKSTVSVIGLGYVGLTTAVVFAKNGIPVVGYEIDPKRAQKIREGAVPFEEPMVKELLKESLKAGTFKVDEKISKLSDIVFLTVGTPSDKRDGGIDLTFVKSVSKMIGEVLRSSDKLVDYPVVVVKSTVVPGTTENTVKPIIEEASGKKVGCDFGLAVNPEFLKEGAAVQDMFEPDRIVIGEFDKRSGDTLERFYQWFYEKKMPPVVRTNLVNAEFIKYASNAFLATKISFINSIANIAQKTPGADVSIIAEGIGLDNRIGRKFLNAGLGYGGSCFPKDVRALIAFSKQARYSPVLLDAVDSINQNQGSVAVKMIDEVFEGNGGSKGKTIAVLGLAFKPNTDDIREAVSIRIIKQLLSSGAKLKVYDPVAMPNVEMEFGNSLTYSKSSLEAIEDSDCAIIVTEWDEFKKLEPKDYFERMKTPIIIDGRRIYDSEKFGKALKFKAIGLGQ
ncbi:MAG: UDP-glucose/GDP-mannose dehydrogenase family protein [archaeon]|nr:UDP-glucose/GDP-mannose dehydrogenase family protein [archaeon]